MGRGCRHLKDLLADDVRNQGMVREFNGIYLDFSRQNATPETLKVCCAARDS